MIEFSVEIELLLESKEYKAIPMSVASYALLLPFYLYLFIFPCAIAAGISGNCAGKIHIIGHFRVALSLCWESWNIEFGFDFDFESD